ncbi:hypothetical protein K2173_024999 [Erythroxylum novogranatense]|uniref:Nucleotide-diphospho-sugar transferase domain-containing protein n=1 Tax=Erythroxylum novogranatense TaxID=1862640 RepID=A0AAV8UD28_9ROSI|nr:hypothetical protein K2173_024999 [Erythroxylum novogranatense]
MLKDISKNCRGNFVSFSLLFAGFVCLLVWSTSTSQPLIFEYRRSGSNCSNPSYHNVKFPIDELQSALEKAAMPNKTVIIAVVNRAYVEQTVESEITMLDLFLESFWLGENTRQLLDHLLVVAVDQTAYERCMFNRLHCYKLETDGVDFAGEKIYMSGDFLKMMWRRTLFVTEVLKQGYNFIFTDIDVLWLRNPMSLLNRNETVDFQISTDSFNGDPLSEKNFINTGFYHARSNNKTIALFETWYAKKNNATGLKEQDVLLSLTQGGVLGQLGINARFLDTLYFSGFCSDSKDITAVTTVHANCCRSIRAKVTDLTAVLRDWKRFKATEGANNTVPFPWTGHFGCRRSWKN